MFDGTEYWCKIWRKTDLRFLVSKNDSKNLANFCLQAEKQWFHFRK